MSSFPAKQTSIFAGEKKSLAGLNVIVDCHVNTSIPFVCRSHKIYFIATLLFSIFISMPYCIYIDIAIIDTKNDISAIIIKFPLKLLKCLLYFTTASFFYGKSRMHLHVFFKTARFYADFYLGKKLKNIRACAHKKLKLIVHFMRCQK